ncbi:PH domain-containing protein [uncultured Clostridium sp.]|uniref:PH domain-containing protein n=1 Tax=uncultured Clostridium sp. TaxID=59620 RepID=UPI00258ECA38|nr:PH domain-containing protein [uncultured Clostridium sp.]
MKSYEYVEEKIENMEEVKTWGTNKEINELPNVLGDNEELIYITSGLYDDNTWLIALTDKRILFLDKGLIYGLKQKDITLDKVNSVEYETGIIFSRIKIWNGAEYIIIDKVLNKYAKIMVSHITEELELYKNRMLRTRIVEETNEDRINQLAKLGKLRDAGVLTQEEFEEAKGKILKDIV